MSQEGVPLAREREDETIVLNGKRITLLLAVCGFLLPLLVAIGTGYASRAATETKTESRLSAIEKEQGRFPETHERVIRIERDVDWIRRTLERTLERTVR